MVWGGVRLDEIPPLERPPRKGAREARFLSERGRPIPSGAFERGGGARELRDETGGRWRVSEEALVREGAPPAEQRLERVPGHLSLWFAWFGFFPDTEVYGRSVNER